MREEDDCCATCGGDGVLEPSRVCYRRRYRLFEQEMATASGGPNGEVRLHGGRYREAQRIYLVDQAIRVRIRTGTARAAQRRCSSRVAPVHADEVDIGVPCQTRRMNARRPPASADQPDPHRHQAGQGMRKTGRSVPEPMRGEQSRLGLMDEAAGVVQRHLAASYHKRGVARALLATGILRLRACGASSVTLGVDANDPAPFHLYQSLGFQMSTSQAAWDKAP
jgi:ribosomal protein S18 acetylase RimI-like enzyme